MNTLIASLFVTVARRRDMARLADLDDRLLADIGLTRHEVRHARTHRHPLDGATGR